MLIETKIFYEGNRRFVVELFRDEWFYTVRVNKDVYKKTANELFAIQAFNEI